MGCRVEVSKEAGMQMSEVCRPLCVGCIRRVRERVGGEGRMGVA